MYSKCQLSSSRRCVSSIHSAFAAIVVSALLLIGSSGNVAAVDLTQEQRRLNIESFDHVWTTVRDKHRDPSLGGLDWQSVREELRPKVEGASSMSEARAVMRSMLERLGQSHCVILPARMYPDTGTGGAGKQLSGEVCDTGCGFDVRVVDDRALVVSVRQGSAADNAGVKKGWEIVRIGNDDPLDHWTHTSAVTSRLLGAAGDSVTVQFLDDQREKVECDIKLGKRRSRQYRFGDLPPMEVWVEYHLLKGNIGYIAFNWFFDPALVMKHFNDAMKSFMKTNGVIIDIRGNGGGIGTMAIAMAGWLIEEQGKYLGTNVLRDCELKEFIYPRAVTYDGHVAVLVNGSSASTAEIFAAGLKAIGRARIFGSRTAGQTLPAGIERLPNGDGFVYPRGNCVSPDGTELEGVGLTPEVVVSPVSRTASLVDDRVIGAAVAWINEQN